MAQEARPTRSTFITVLSWLFIVGAGFAVLISMLQNIMIHTMMPAEVPMPPDDGHMPGVFRFLFANIRLFFLGFLVLAVVTLWSAVGLLKRRNWARLVFVALFGLAIVWNVGTVALQQSVMSAMAPPGAPALPPEFEQAKTYLLVFGVVFALAASALCAWLIKKLVSSEVRAEFEQAT